jgi:hypothetical protein
MSWREQEYLTFKECFNEDFRIGSGTMSVLFAFTYFAAFVDAIF